MKKIVMSLLVLAGISSRALAYEPTYIHPLTNREALPLYIAIGAMIGIMLLLAVIVGRVSSQRS